MKCYDVITNKRTEAYHSLVPSPLPTFIVPCFQALASGVAKGGLAGHVPGQSIMFIPLS